MITWMGNFMINDVKNSYRYKMLEWYMKLMTVTPYVNNRFMKFNNDTDTLELCRNTIDIENIDDYFLWGEHKTLNGNGITIMFTEEFCPEHGETCRLINPIGKSVSYKTIEYRSEHHYEFLKMGWIYPDTDLANRCIEEHVNAILLKPLWV